MTHTPYVLASAGAYRRGVTCARSCARWISIAVKNAGPVPNLQNDRFPPGLVVPARYADDPGAVVVWSSHPQTETHTPRQSGWRKSPPAHASTGTAERRGRSAVLALSCGRWVARVTNSDRN